MVFALRDWLVKPEQIEASLQELASGPDLDGINTELDSLKKRIATLEQERRRLTDMAASGSMDAIMYREADNLRLRQLDAATARIDELERQADAIPDVEERREMLEALAWSFPVLVLEHDPPDVARALAAARVRIWCANGLIQRIESH